MASTSAFRLAGRLSLATTLLMFGLIVLGSVVRTTGSGLACPDWPLCQGKLIPPFQFNVLIEWFHRLAALLVSVLLFATVGWTVLHGDVRARLGGLAALAVVLLAAQVLLGALTVWKLLSPAVVSVHLAVALLLFTTLLAFTAIARAHAEPDATVDQAPRPAGLLPTFASATLLSYAQALLGGLVSTSHAGLACPDWPTCNGRLFPPLEGLEGLHMLHRYGAYALVALMMLVAIRSRSAPDPAIRAAGSAAFGLTLAQVVLGVTNVLLGTPVWLSAMHLATAAAILALLVVGSVRLALGTARGARLALVTS